MRQWFGISLAPHVSSVRGLALVALQATPDVVIALSGVVIPIALLVLRRRRKDLDFQSVFLLFALFILGCGVTHAFAVVTLWVPIDGLAGLVKAITAFASLATAVLFLRMLPGLTRLPSALALQNEIVERERVEREIRDANRYLEVRVSERTNELERTNLRLVESELRVRSILDGTGTLVFVKDLQGRYTFGNEAFIKTTGRSREDVLGHTDAELFSEAQARNFTGTDERAVRGGPFEFEEVGRTGDAEAVYLCNKFPLLDFAGKAYAVCGVATDVTEHRESERAVLRAHEELRNSEERLRQVMDLVPDMLWSANVEGARPFSSNRFISQRYLNYTGCSAKQFEDNGFMTLFHPEDVPKILATYQDSIETGDSSEVEVRIRRHDGVYRWFLSRTVPVWNENFQVEYLIGAVTDIHELKRTEQALRRSNEELEQFAYAAAHDLQEPLRNVSTSLGMLERMIEDRITPEESEWIQKSIQNALRMQAMVKDLLLYCRAIRDHDTAPPPIKSEVALQMALENLSEAISEARARITVSDLKEVPVLEQHMVLLFQNLVSNSLKYRKPGEAPDISVTGRNRGLEWEFAVADNGIGFDPIYAERIFKVFKRLHSRDEYAGNGIGLAICARIVAHYGGRIWAEGLPGQGATFRFTLPTHQK